MLAAIDARLKQYCEKPPTGFVTSSEDFIRLLLSALLSHNEFNYVLYKQMKENSGVAGEILSKFVKYLGCNHDATNELVTQVAYEFYSAPENRPNLRDLEGKLYGP